MLWNYPEAIFYILKNSEEQNKLADFFMNNFFNNYMSGNNLENNLLYLIAMILKEEIEQMKDLPGLNNFLENSLSSLLLKEMINFPDIQLYFRTIIFETVEKMEKDFSWAKMNFNMAQISHDLKKFIKEEDKKSSKKKKKNVEELCKKFINTIINERSINIIENEDDDKISNGIDLDNDFLDNTISIKKEDLENLAKSAESQNKKDYKYLILSLLENMKVKKDPTLYENSFLEPFTKDKEINLNFLLFIYQHDFKNIINLVDIFINDLFNNIEIIPDSIKYICKLISLLIKNKFKDIPKYLENALISKFFVDKLLIPMFQSPNYNALINDFIISGYTKNNLNFIVFILKKIFSGKLFQVNTMLPNGEEEKYLTIFNKYILNNMEKIFLFYEKAINISLPSFIDKYINNKLPSDYLYDYFCENPEEIYANITICFNLNNLISILNTLKKCENDFFSVENYKNVKLKKIFNKLKSENRIKELIKLEKDGEAISSSKKINNLGKSANYYILVEREIESNYKNIFKINNNINGFYIDIKKLEKEKQLEEKEKNLVKFKNYLIASLTNFSSLKQSSFDTTEGIYSILSQIKKILMFPQLINDVIPSNWSVSSVLDYMQKIPEEYKENDYDKCFEELTQDLQESISSFDFDKLFNIKKMVESLEKVCNFYKLNLKIIEDINNNEKLKSFSEDFCFPIEVKFYYEENSENNKFEIKKSNKRGGSKNNDFIENKNDKAIFRSISSFIKYFPDLNKYQEIFGVNPFQIITDLSINKKLFDFFELVKNVFIQENNDITEKEYREIYDLKMKNYIMNKIYKKIYPKEFEFDDSRLFEKTMHLSWVEPSMIIKGDISLDALDNILPDILAEFKKLNKAYSPYVKLFCIKKIFELIGVIVKFNDGGEGSNREIGAEDITPYLNFVLIRACPIKIFSDIKFIKLFLKNEGKFEYDFLNVEMMCKSILESNYKNYNISESEYIKKCNEAININKNNSQKRLDEIIERTIILDN